MRTHLCATGVATVVWPTPTVPSAYPRSAVTAQAQVQEIGEEIKRGRGRGREREREGERGREGGGRGREWEREGKGERGGEEAQGAGH